MQTEQTDQSRIILNALNRYVAKPPRLRLENYDTVAEYKDARRRMERDARDFRTMLIAITFSSALMPSVEELRRAIEPPLGMSSQDGELVFTAHTRAPARYLACLTLANAIKKRFRALNMDSNTFGAAKRFFGLGVARRWFQ